MTFLQFSKKERERERSEAKERQRNVEGKKEIRTDEWAEKEYVNKRLNKQTYNTVHRKFKQYIKEILESVNFWLGAGIMSLG